MRIRATDTMLAKWKKDGVPGTRMIALPRGSGSAFRPKARLPASST
jgi:hypothetical protein